MEKDEIYFNAKLPKRKQLKNLLSDLDDLEEVPLPSSINKQIESKKEKKKAEKKEKKKSKESEYDTDEWINTIMDFKTPKAKKSNKKLFKGFNPDGTMTSKKPKKSKKEGETVNYNKEFDLELRLLKNLQADQNKFVDSLQQKYNQLENTKSSARGVGKYTTDLINSISSARSTSLQIVDKIISTKKSIADLNFKERKEFGAKTSSEQENLTNYASTYLKQVMNVGRSNIIPSVDSSSLNDDVSDEDLFSSIDLALGDTGRSSQVESYLKYENSNVTVSVIYDDDNDTHEFIAEDGDGNLLTDYPLPISQHININRSNMVATDEFGKKYPLIIRGE